MALPKQKLDNIKKGVRKLKEEKEVVTRQIARVLRLMVATHPAVLLEPIYYRCLQQEKIRAVRHQGYSSRTHLMPQTREELNWLLNCQDQHNGNSLQIRQWDLVTKRMPQLRAGVPVVRREDPGQDWKREPHKLFGVAGGLPSIEGIYTGHTSKVY